MARAFLKAFSTYESTTPQKEAINKGSLFLSIMSKESWLGLLRHADRRIKRLCSVGRNQFIRPVVWSTQSVNASNRMPRVNMA